MIGHLSHKDLPYELRKKSALQERDRIKAYLSNPILKEEDRQVLLDKLSKLDKWEQGLPLEDLT